MSIRTVEIARPATLNIIGAGRVASTLGRLLANAHRLVVQDVLSRRLDSAQAACAFIGQGRAIENISAMAPAELVLIATPDDAIEEVARSLSVHARAQHWPETLVWHCSGFKPAAVLNALNPIGAARWPLASVHPVLSFASPDRACAQFHGSACALEGDSSALARLRPMFDALGADCFEVAGCDKPLYHAGAVFATNFMVVVQSLAEQAWRDSGVPPEVLARMSKQMLRNCADNLLSMGPEQALTGPASRGDTAVVHAQAAAVGAWDPVAGQAYQALSEIAARIARQRAARK